ncbi:hypothetical protein [Devosia sp. MC1541]|uniref:hypothetical protein n=1 Tax=Devosia sp. MC1541 TaxID=2725264 RepID=UPI00145D2DE6|nr:hypothetical protein [Devosia sp. MC1541]
MCELLTNIRNTVADLATWDPVDQSRTEFVYAAISIWSRVLAVFRTGALPKSSDEYQAVSSSGLRQLATDDNALAAGLGTLAMALSMLQHGRETALWSISAPVGAGIEHGAFTATGTWDGAPARPVFLVKGIGEALALQQSGAFANDNAIVLHADTTWSQVMASNASARRVGSSPGRSGRNSKHHISIESLVDRCDTADLLKSEFITEASI